MPGHQCRLPAPFVGLAHLLGSLRDSISSTSWRSSWALARQRGDTCSPCELGALAWCLPPCLLLSLRLELLLPPLNLYPVTFKTVLRVSVLAACTRRDLESGVILGQC